MAGGKNQKKKNKKSLPPHAAAGETYRVKSRKQRNKTRALLLVISLVVLLSVYFGFVRAGFYAVQNVYIVGGTVLAAVYLAVSFFLAMLREKAKKESESDKNSENTHSKTIRLLDRLRTLSLILIIPVLFALLADYMLIVLGFADRFGI